MSQVRAPPCRGRPFLSSTFFSLFVLLFFLLFCDFFCDLFLVAAGAEPEPVRLTGTQVSRHDSLSESLVEGAAHPGLLGSAHEPTVSEAVGPVARESSTRSGEDDRMTAAGLGGSSSMDDAREPNRKRLRRSQVIMVDDEEVSEEDEEEHAVTRIMGRRDRDSTI